MWINRQALQLRFNRDGEQLRLPERVLLAFCRPVNAPPLPTPSGTYTLDNALDYALKTVPCLLDLIRSKTVLDYGCGQGYQAVALARSGAARVFGLDINDTWIDSGRSLAASAGVTNVTFGKSPDAETYDVIVNLSAIEHFRDPAREVQNMLKMTRERLVISWAQPWYSPYGTHLDGTTRIPWLNLIFSEKTLMNVRNLYPDGSDGASRFEDVRGGLNKLTVRRFERIIGSVKRFEVEYFRLFGVKRVPLVTKVPVLRELMTSAAACVLRCTSNEDPSDERLRGAAMSKQEPIGRNVLRRVAADTGYYSMRQ
jgi:2-polyprenyl-3-methyl-5-hydroxy-6-metoxy-1,4-benzoquinol methylase